MPTTARSESADPTPASDPLPVDVDAVRATVARTLKLGPAPCHEDLVELERLLRSHVELLLPLAEKAVGRMSRGSVEWYGQRSWLDIARSRAARGLGVGLITAHTHVRLLAHDCRALLRYAEAAGR